MTKTSCPLCGWPEIRAIGLSSNCPNCKSMWGKSGKEYSIGRPLWELSCAKLEVDRMIELSISVESFSPTKDVTLKGINISVKIPLTGDVLPTIMSLLKQLEAFLAKSK